MYARMTQIGGLVVSVLALGAVEPQPNSATAPAPQAMPASIHVRAWVDGRSHLIFDDHTVRWQHFDWAAPGRHRCQAGEPIQPTVVDGIEWFPEWPDVPDCENRWCGGCLSSVYTGLAGSLPDAYYLPEIVEIEVRGSCSLFEVPTAANGYRTVVEFNDNGPSGPAWYEIDLLIGACEAQSFCISTPNSTGKAASIGMIGPLSVSANAAVLEVSGCPPGNFGIFFCGVAEAQIPLGNGWLCIDPFTYPGLTRIPPAVLIDASGYAALPLDLSVLPSHAQPGGGGSSCFQFWYRDPAAGGAGSNFSDAVRATFCH